MANIPSENINKETAHPTDLNTSFELLGCKKIPCQLIMIIMYKITGVKRV